MICHYQRLLPPKGQFLAIPGRFSGRRKPKLSARIGTVIPLSCCVCPFIYQKLRLWARWGAPRLKTDAKPSRVAFAFACLWRYLSRLAGWEIRREFSGCPG